MKPRMSSPQRGESGLLDLFVMIIAVVIVGLVGYAYLTRPRRISTGMNCVNNLKQIGISFRIWGGDNGEKFPALVSTNAGGAMELVPSGLVFPNFVPMSNEVSTPKILVCPEDSKRTAAANFSTLTDSNISYFVVLEADEALPSMLLSGDRNLTTNNVPLRPGLFTMPTNNVLGWTRQIHSTGTTNRGNICYTDASVQQATSRKLHSLATNALADYLTTTNAPFRLIIP